VSEAEDEVTRTGRKAADERSMKFSIFSQRADRSADDADAQVAPDSIVKQPRK